MVGVLVLGGAALWLTGPGMPRWLGTALLLGGLWEARFVIGKLPDRLSAAAPYAVLLTAYVALFWELLIGRPPATRDHGIHYFQTRLLWDSFIPSGRLWGWSDALGAGYPFGESYPVLGYVLGGLPHALSFGLIGTRASYALGIAITWALGTLAVGWLAHAIVGTMHRHSIARRWAFCVGGLLWLFDAGASRQGGWNYLMFHGVWPQMFSAVLWALSLTLTTRALERPTYRRVAAAALVLGASLMAHPFGMLAAAASAGLFGVVILFAPGEMPAPLRTWAAVHLGAGVVAAGVLVVFFGSAGAMARSPVQWSPLGQLSYETLSGGLFPTHWVWLGPLFVLGVLAVVRRPSALGLLGVLLVAALVVLGSHESMTVLRLDLLVSGFKNLQFPRYTIELKPVMFAVGGVGAITVPAALRAVAPREVPSRPLAWLFVAIATPFVATLVPDVGRLATRPVGAIDTLEANPEGEHDTKLLEALRAEAAGHPEGLKVAYLRAGMGGGMFPLFAITDAGADLVLDGHIAAVNFKHRIRREAVAYDALGVTHVIHDRPLGEKDPAFERRLEQIGRFGRYRLTRYTPERPIDAVTVDEGSATLDIDSTERVALDVESAGPTRVVLSRAPHLRWDATFEGESVEIEEMRRVRGLTLLGVRVPGSGRLELSYRRAPKERVAGWASALAWLLGLVALTSGRPIPFRRRASWPRSLVPVLLGAGVLAVLFVARMQANNLERTWQHFAAERAYRGAAKPEDEATASERPVLVRDLVDEGALTVRRTPERACNGLQGKDVLAGCSEAEHAPIRATTYRAPYLYRCVEFGLPPGGVAEIQLGDGRHDVLGRLTRRLLGSPGRGLTFGVAQVPTPSKLSSDNLDFFAKVEQPGQPVVAVLRNGGRHMERFCLSAAEVSAPEETR